MAITGYRETVLRGTSLFPFQHYHMSNAAGDLFVPYHWHSETEIIYMLEGSLTLSVGGQDDLLSPGDICFINSGEPHQFASSDPAARYYAYVFPLESLYFQQEDSSQTQFLTPLGLKRLFPRRLPADSPVNAALASHILEIIRINETKETAYELGTKAELYHIISLLVREHLFLELADKKEAASHSRSRDVRTLLLYIQNHYGEKIRLEDAAAAMHISPKYFCTYFKEITGKNFVAYVNRFRVEKACHLLLTTELSVMDIAMETGFDNLSYFIKTFKAVTGHTPGRYRKVHAD